MRQARRMVDKGGRSQQRKRSLNWRRWRWQYVPEA